MVQRAALLGDEVFTGLRPPDPVYVQLRQLTSKEGEPGGY